MQVGFIGTGSMGSILIEAFITAESLQPNQIHATNRTFSKVKELAHTFGGLHAYTNNQEVAQQVDLLFLCIKPKEFKKVIDEIRPCLHSEQIVVSITSPVEIRDLEMFLPAKVAKIIPSITNWVCSGASLLMAGERVTEKDKELLYSLMKSISTPLWVDEKYTRVSSDIVSCGPAFFSYLFQQFIDAAVRETGISQEEATRLTSSMVIGLGQLLAVDKFSLTTLQDRVCVPGGITGEGLKVLAEDVNDMFDKVFQATHQKFYEDTQEVADLFYVKKEQ